MAKDKKSFQLYTEWIEVFRELDNEDAGELIKHIFSYVNDENPETNNKLVKLSFIQIKQQLKRDLEKWENIRERNTENGKKGGRPKTKRNPDNPMGSLGNPNKPKEPVEVKVEVEVEEKDKVKEKVKGTTNSIATGKVVPDTSFSKSSNYNTMSMDDRKKEKIGSDFDNMFQDFK